MKTIAGVAATVLLAASVLPAGPSGAQPFKQAMEREGGYGPFYTIHKQRYSVYWQLKDHPTEAVKE